jgi:hypothetical protein
MRRATLLGLLLTAACQSKGAGPTTDPAVPSPSTPSLALTVRDLSGGSGPFVLDDLEKLSIAALAVHVSAGDHALRLDVTGPDGTLYAQLSSPVQADQSQQGSSTTNLQVRGTTIETYRQLGTWQVMAVLDGTPMASATVELVGAAR